LVIVPGVQEIATEAVAVEPEEETCGELLPDIVCGVKAEMVGDDGGLKGITELLTF